MITTEQQLLDAGFDFHSRAGELATRHPLELDWGVRGFRVVRFPLPQTFGSLPLVWNIPVNRELDFDLPPLRYGCEFHPAGEARVNHDHAVSQLASVLGSAGVAGTAANVYERHWRIGIFTIRVLTWPRELNRGGHNVFAGRNPYLWISANVSIEPDLPFIEFVDEVSFDTLVEIETATLVCDSQPYGRRCKAPRETRAGLTANCFVIDKHDRTVRVPLAEVNAVVHTRATPGRYSGSSSLALTAHFLGRHQVRVPVARGPATNSLDHAARTLAAALAKPLEVQQYSDDG